MKDYTDLIIWVSECLDEVDNIKIDWRVLKKYSDDFLDDNKIKIEIHEVEMKDEDTAVCLECKAEFIQDRDIQLCDNCCDKFDLDKLWELHDGNKIDAINFNESKTIRERFRVRK